MEVITIGSLVDTGNLCTGEDQTSRYLQHHITRPTSDLGPSQSQAVRNSEPVLQTHYLRCPTLSLLQRERDRVLEFLDTHWESGIVAEQTGHKLE